VAGGANRTRLGVAIVWNPVNDGSAAFFAVFDGGAKHGPSVI